MSRPKTKLVCVHVTRLFVVWSVFIADPVFIINNIITCILLNKYYNNDHTLDTSLIDLFPHGLYEPRGFPTRKVLFNSGIDKTNFSDHNSINRKEGRYWCYLIRLVFFRWLLEGRVFENKVRCSCWYTMWRESARASNLVASDNALSRI